jgi:hypothetical protein
VMFWAKPHSKILASPKNSIFFLSFLKHFGLKPLKKA